MEPIRTEATVSITTPIPSVVLLEVLDAEGQRVLSRRVHEQQHPLRLPSSAATVSVTDTRPLHDPARLSRTTRAVTAGAHVVLDLARGGVLHTTTSRWARLTASHVDGERLECRADGRGHAVLAGLRPGGWTVVAHDARRELCSEAVTVSIGGRGDARLDLPVTTPTARLLVQVPGSDRRPVMATEITVTDQTGRRVTAPLHGGLADVSDLRPGRLHVSVPPSVGHLGATVEVTVESGTLSSLVAVSPVGASLSGRVVQGNRLLGAPGALGALVTLLDEEGAEIERVRTDEDGRFVLGTGLRATRGLTVVATTGPETLHVTRAAVADVCVCSGVRHHLGDIELPVAGRRAVWAARTPAVAGMRLPSTHV